jgi:hypothetical protein
LGLKTQIAMKKGYKILVIPSYYEIHVFRASDREVELFSNSFTGVCGLLENGNVFNSLEDLYKRIGVVGFDDCVCLDRDLMECADEWPETPREWIEHSCLWRHWNNTKK